MKKTILSIASVLILSLLLQSCFEIKEIVRINKDGSGTFSMSIDMSEVKAMVEGLSQGEEDSGSPLGEMEAEYEATKSKLEVIEGISNIQFHTENDGYVITTSFDFADVDALNKGMNVVYEDENEYGEITEYYTFKRTKFERTSAHNMLDQLKGEMGSGELGGGDIDMAEIFSDVAYVNIVEFNGRKIKKTSSKDIEISEDGSSMTLKKYIFREDEDLAMDYSVKVR